MASRRDRSTRKGVSLSLFYGKKLEEEEVDNAGLSDSDDSVKDPDYDLPPEHRDIIISHDSDGDKQRDSDGDNVGELESGRQAPTKRGRPIPHGLVVAKNRPKVGGEGMLGESSEASTGAGGGKGSAAGGEASAGGGEGSAGGEEGGRESRPRIRGRGRETPTTREKKGRKASRGLSADEEVKKKRNLGLEYVSYRTGKKVEAKRVRSPCKDGCYDRVNDNARQAILKNFWSIGNFNEQNYYISQHVKPVPVKRRYGGGKHSVPRQNFEYSVKYLNETFKICRVAFMHIHDISNGRLQGQMHRMRLSETGTSPADKRGRHGTEPKMKITGIRLARVHEHIQSLPTTASHYTRAKSPHRQYLEDIASVKDLYDMYKVWLSENEYEEEPVKLEYYRKVFAQEYNISFRPPKKDTCSTCDATNASMQQKRDAGEDDSDLQATLDAHKALAKEAQALLGAQAKIVPTEGEPIVKSIAMDLQQTLPCPRISTGLAYYLRKLWVYNFCIHDIQKGKGSMFVWDEATGGRGSDEVASCLLKWIKLRQDEGEVFNTLRIFCDNCAGQNKNLYVLLAALRMVHGEQVARIELIFLISGHSFLPCDRNFGVLEKKFKAHNAIHTPERYAEVIAGAVTPPFEVITMKSDDFLNIKTLAEYVTRRATGGTFHIARQLVVDKNYKEGYLLKSDYVLGVDDSPNTTKCRLMKSRKGYNKKLFDLSSVTLAPKYPELRRLDGKKVKDLQTLTQFLGPSSSRNWLVSFVEQQRELQQRSATSATQHGDDDDEFGSDEENDLNEYSEPRRRTQ